MQRQNEGHIPPFPIWDDVCTFDGSPWRGIVDVVSGGFPCQDISSANPNAQGIEGSRSGLWKQMHRIVREVLPTFVLVENSPMLVGRGLAVVLGDFAEIGYNARWDYFSAEDAGADHERERIFILAYSDHERKPAFPVDGKMGVLPKLDCLSESSKRGGKIPTPTTSDAKGSSMKRFLGSEEYRGNMREFFRTGMEDGQYPNPSLSEYLMGWPIGWTAREPLETDKFQRWLSLHGKPCPKA
jgi:DNA (cytosine-5)-methyltransferase 1